jgi:hypothetical protein
MASNTPACPHCGQPDGLLNALPDLVSIALSAIPGASAFAAPAAGLLTSVITYYLSGHDIETIRRAPTPSMHKTLTSEFESDLRGLPL